MTKEQALAEVGNAIYRAALIFEKLEHDGLIVGNGHHAAQNLADQARCMLEQRWIDPKDKTANTTSDS